MSAGNSCGIVHRWAILLHPQAAGSAQAAQVAEVGLDRRGEFRVLRRHGLNVTERGRKCKFFGLTRVICCREGVDSSTSLGMTGGSE